MGLVAFFFSWPVVVTVEKVLAVEHVLVLGSDSFFFVCKSL